ncbi:RagB/SusD family nutrient uptake outer membrane protein [Pseudobacter ginsenosidimutans]|uniref:SusD-like starch-binding protein associating with outer membrane n=1 Tax=Pseudobacter ginsenosidimutans TaxID=661488 RepID=A0A4Q7MXE0_9BACT|nr:RagB/SusD family nutrient uptake outer membrane protein [Pseudobacter ginsenosidimutans]QEC40543.1 RagB/SusD family nutrient uptake outer membrane protein [Pseudobacter ginsenosidimutans]RZS72744.1 SusD-like starch-binding protein associating with outer membrane [Pseudobacter ginsenosidimutans]
MKPVYTILIAALIFISPSCKKFLAAYSQNQTFIQSAGDLDELLIGGGYPLESLWQEPYWLDDDLEQNPGLSSKMGSLEFGNFGLHFWQKFPATSGRGIPNVSYGTGYKSFYQKIATLNTILFNIPALREKHQPEKELQRIAGEAHFLRAFYYLLLTNIYGKPYHAATSATDYSVPLKISPEVETGYLTRASVKQVFNQIEIDLLDAEKELNGFNESTVLRASQAAAQALLSRLYLFREEYEKAISYAEKVIQKRYQLRDINTLSATTPFLERASPETIFTARYIGGTSLTFMNDANDVGPGFENYRVTEDLLGIYSNKDLRLQAFFKQTPDYDLIARKSGENPNVNDNSIVRLPELYLNKAEALAVLGQHEKAIATIQELRKKRFKQDDVTNIDLSGAELVHFIRDERRREFCFEQHRWFDLRRYGVNSKYPFGKAIRHRSFAYDASGRYVEGYYELKPYAEEPAAYVLPILDKEIEFNKGNITNEPRPDRPLIP